MELKLPISLGQEGDNNSDYRDQIIENLVIVPRQTKGFQGYLVTHPGITSFSTGEGVDRASVYNARQGAHYRLSGDKFIKLDPDGTKTVIGTTAGTTQGRMPYSFQTQAILSSNRFWLYDGITLTEVLDEDLGAPIDVDWINGVYFFTDGENLYHTTAASEFSIDSLSFATSEFSPDRTLGVLRNQQNQMVVFNRFSTEWFVDRASENFRFSRIEGKAVKVGIVGTHCKAELDGRIFVLGSRIEESPSVHILEGGTETTVATREVDQILETYTESELATGVLEARVERRNKYLYVRLPRHTLLYNHTIGQTHGIEQAWTILRSDLSDTPWRGTNGVYDPDATKWIYGDRTTSNIGYLDESTFAQYGEQQEAVCYTPIVRDLETMSIDEVEIGILPGNSSEEINMFASFSYDGKTYGQEYSESISSGIGDYNKRYSMCRLGYVRHNFNMKFRMVSSSPMSFTGVELKYS